MSRWLAISSESEHIGCRSVLQHVLKAFLQGLSDLFACGAGELGPMVGIESTFAVYAIECANLAVGRHEVNAEADSEAPTVNRAENGGGVNDGAHIVKR